MSRRGHEGGIWATGNILYLDLAWVMWVHSLRDHASSSPRYSTHYRMHVKDASSRKALNEIRGLALCPQIRACVVFFLSKIMLNKLWETQLVSLQWYP